MHLGAGRALRLGLAFGWKRQYAYALDPRSGRWRDGNPLPVDVVSVELAYAFDHGFSFYRDHLFQKEGDGRKMVELVAMRNLLQLNSNAITFNRSNSLARVSNPRPCFNTRDHALAHVPGQCSMV